MRMKDITGQRFGRLVAIEPDRSRSTLHGAYWLCECDCGNKTVVRSEKLRSGRTKSCGCLRVERMRERARKNHTENKKHFKCPFCGSDKHYVKGFCRACYNKLRTGTL